MYLRKLTELDSDLVAEVIKGCKNYYRDVEGVKEYNFTEEFVEEEVDSFINSYETDEYYTEELKIGVFEKIDNKERILGITQLLLNHRIEGVMTVGLTLIKKTERGKGVGRWLHNMIVKISQKKNQKKLSLGVDKQNSLAQKFWNHFGYKKVEEVKIHYKFKESIIIFLEKNIFEE